MGTQSKVKHFEEKFIYDGDTFSDMSSTLKGNTHQRCMTSIPNLEPMFSVYVLKMFLCQPDVSQSCSATSKYTF